MLSYLLAFVQLTWQVDNGWFCQFMMIFLIEFYIGLMYVRGCETEVWGWSWWCQKLKQRSKMTQTVEIRVAIMCTYFQKGQYSLQGLDRCALKVGVISGPYG